MAAPPPAGIYVPVPTFFQPSTTSSLTSFALSTPPLDTAAQSTHALHLAKNGIKGLVLLGSTGEAVHLARSERKTVISSVRASLTDAGFPDYPLIAGTATNGIGETVDLLNDAKESGAQYGLVLAPSYFASALNHKSGLEGIEGWFTAVAEASPIPIMVYHYPGVSNNIRIPASTIVSLAQHPNIVGCKLSHGDISTHAQVALSPSLDSSSFAVYTGLGQQLLPVITVGGAGAIDGLAAIFPKTVVRLFEASTKGDLEEARRLQYLVSSAEELVVKWGTVGIKEAIKRLLEIGTGAGGRLPLSVSLPDGEWEAWEGVLGDVKTVEDGL